MRSLTTIVRSGRVMASWRGLACIAVLAALLPGCAKKSDRGERANVSVSIFPLYDLVRRIAGPDADVTLLVPPGKSEHDYQPTPKDVETARRAKLGVMVGLGLDAWMEQLMKEAAPKARVLQVGDRVPTIMERDTPDPHVWLDPQRAQLIVRAITEELGRVDPAHVLGYRERSAQLDSALAAVDKEAEDRLKALPQKGFITDRGSFGYFAERYHLSIVSVVEPSPGATPRPEWRSKVLGAIREKKVAALFNEPQIDAQPAKAVADEAKVPIGVLDPLGGNPETDSYEKLIRFDVDQLEKQLR